MLIFDQNELRILNDKKRWWTIPHENRNNGGFTCFGARLTFKMGCFGRGDQPDP